MISWPVDRAPAVGIPRLCMRSSVFERRAHIISFRGAIRMVLETSCTGFPASHIHRNTCGYGDLV
ncbi:hypothetical protein M405DRAFT_204331 [Rhizopogon salebrosus TDB-379]|nr:hypothetical protein M405DRAFT_204331 [Rhizopogon salebrosus TDB-379]